MKALAILFRVVFSIVLLLATASYLQVAPTITFGDFCNTITADSIIGMFNGVNAVTIGLIVILLLGIFSFTRILEAAWNILFCASIISLLAGGMYALFGPGIALPHAIYHNDAVNQFCQAMLTYQVPIALLILIFIAGWLCSAACIRVALTAAISYGLWYGVSELFTYIVYLWSNASEPAMPEALNMIQASPWIVSAVPAAFFLIYAILMAFFETFITHTSTRKEPSKPATPASKDEQQETKPEADKVKEPAAKPEPSQPAAKPKLSTKPVVEPKQKTLRLATPTPAGSKKLNTPSAAPAKPEPAPEAPDKAEEPKPEATPETPAKPEEPKPEATPESPAKPEEAKAEAAPEAPAKPEETKAEATPEAPAKAEECKTESPA